MELGPSLSNFAPEELEAWGKRRKPICQAFEDHAVQLFDQVSDSAQNPSRLAYPSELLKRAIIRTPTAMNISTCLMLLLLKHQGKQ